MKFALVFENHGVVPVAFALDLANAIGHLASTRPAIEIRLLAADSESTEEQRRELIEEAEAWGAGATMLLRTDVRFPPDAFDELLDEADAETRRPKLVNLNGRPMWP